MFMMLDLPIPSPIKQLSAPNYFSNLNVCSSRNVTSITFNGSFSKLKLRFFKRLFN